MLNADSIFAYCIGVADISNELVSSAAMILIVEPVSGAAAAFQPARRTHLFMGSRRCDVKAEGWGLG